MKNLKEIRIAAGFKTRSVFAKAMGISLTTAQNWENEVSAPHGENLRKLEKLIPSIKL